MTNTACVCWSQHASCAQQHSVTVSVNSNPVCCAPHTHKSSQITINRERAWYNTVWQPRALQVGVFHPRGDQHLTEKAEPDSEPVSDTSRLKHLSKLYHLTQADNKATSLKPRPRNQNLTGTSCWLFIIWATIRNPSTHWSIQKQPSSFFRFTHFPLETCRRLPATQVAIVPQRPYIYKYTRIII